MNENSAVIERICDALQENDVKHAASIAQAGYPFLSIQASKVRKCTKFEMMSVFLRDGFIDRYSGARLLFPGVLRLLTLMLPTEFPHVKNWTMSDTHIAYWELFPTIDHINPIARGGKHIKENWITTTQVRNNAKGNSTADELSKLGWQIFPAGQLTDWDGLTTWSIEYLGNHRERAPSAAHPF